jgi:hypothetical protein
VNRNSNCPERDLTPCTLMDLDGEPLHDPRPITEDGQGALIITAKRTFDFGDGLRVSYPVLRCISGR